MKKTTFGLFAALLFQVTILFHSDPNPLKVGTNKFEVLLKDGKKEVKDAEVTVVFGASTVPLKYRAAGIYRGSGEITTAGDGVVTIVAKRDGREVATRRLTVA